MILNKLRLTDFRNYSKKELDLSEKTTLVIGQNTVGKTNLLESICLLATGRSFRATLEQEMIGWEKQIARVKGRVIVGKDKTDLEIVLTRGLLEGEKIAKKKYLVNGVSRRMADFVGNLRAVYFGPEDLDLVTDSPSLRRKYLDFVLTQVDKEYTRSLLSYEKGLRQRNKLLERIRDEGVPMTQLLFWDQLLVKNGDYLTKERQQFIDFTNSQFLISNSQYALEYDKSIISPARLEEYSEEEVVAGATLVGPHRDDFVFRLKNRDLHAFGSRGEQRMGILWLKLAELEFIAQKAGDRPVLLLDDIFSELDKERRVKVLKIIPQQQTIVTTTEIHQIDPGFRKKLEVICLT